MRTNPLLASAVIACALSLPAAPAQSVKFRFERAGGVPFKLVWDSLATKTYDLWRSGDLAQWTRVDGYPKAGTGAPMEHPFTAGLCGFFRITAETPAPEGFVLIPAGSFLMGDQSSPLVGWSDELPVHSVYVSAFYMAKYEVTKALWDEVAGWAAGNGYDISTGGASGKASNHPAFSVTWYECVKWCNARSQREGLTPCYTVSGATYKTGSRAPVCNWSANGYRLPTEAEWEKAARGGVVGKNFPWGDTISHSLANFRNDGGESYQTGTTGPHPTYNTGYPNTSPVGSFAPNGYGLYDMAGNLREWCWDWYSSYSSGSQTDPRGPTSGSFRVDRGGNISRNASSCRAAARDIEYADYEGSGSFMGFRPARRSVP